jgi:hypothetical protein
MELVCPKKGIYKDGHEREDTLIRRREYGDMLATFADRETTYSGARLDISHPPRNTLLREIIRLYHDECIFASHEGTLQMWVEKGVQANYRKPRGHVLMSSGFICRCHGMLEIKAAEVPKFLEFLEERHRKSFTVAEDFPMSSKIYAERPVTHAGMLCSFTMIQPGKGYDDYWVNDDVYRHLIEVAYLSEYVHFNPKPDGLQPQSVVIFDGSSNHGARAPDALHVGEGICLGPGGKNAPGSKPSLKNTKGLPKMRDGWYCDEVPHLFLPRIYLLSFPHIPPSHPSPSICCRPLFL